MKRALVITVGVVALLVVAIVVIPPLINLGKYKARYLPLAEQALNRKVDVAEIRLRIVPAPAIRLSGLQVADDPAFSSGAFFTAEHVSLRLKLGSLLRGRLEAEQFVLEKPVFNLLKRSDGTFNFADIAKKKEETAKKGKKESAPKTRESAKLAHFVPTLVRISDGAVTLQAPGQKPLHIDGIDVSLRDFSAERLFPYRIALKAPGLKPISLEGQMRYEEKQGVLTVKDSRLKAEDVEFRASGTISDLTGAPKMNFSLDNDEFEVKPIVRLLAAAGMVPKEFEASGPVGLRVRITGPSNDLLSQIDAKLKGLKVNDSRAFKGTVAGEINLAAPLGGSVVRRTRGRGAIAAKDGVLTNVDLVKKIEQVTGLIGMPQEERAGATTFDTLESDFTMSSGVAEFKRIYLRSPVMEARGGGRMNLEPQTLDLGLEAALASSVSARLASAKTTTFVKDSQGRVVVPLKITGPIKSPSVSLDSTKLVKKSLGPTLDKRKEPSIFDRIFNRR